MARPSARGHQPRLPWTPRPVAELREELRAVGTPVALEILRLGCNLEGWPEVRAWLDGDPSVGSLEMILLCAAGRRFEDGMRRRFEDAKEETRC